MKKTTILFGLMISLFFSCKKDKQEITVCGVKNPLKNISWLNSEYLKIQNNSTINGIVLYQYNGQNIIEIQSALSSAYPDKYLCDGTKLDLVDPTAFNKYKQERKEITVLFGTKLGK